MRHPSRSVLSAVVGAAGLVVGVTLPVVTADGGTPACTVVYAVTSIGTWSGSNAVPTTFKLNGTTCVNRSGGEFMCVQGRGIRDGPVDDPAIEYAGANYVNAVKDLVARIELQVSVAITFKGDPAVVFDLFNEPYPYRATSHSTVAPVAAQVRYDGTPTAYGIGLRDHLRALNG